MTPLLAPRARLTDRAFERIYRRHAGDVYRYSLAVLRNPADAEDVTQTTFLNAYRAFQRGERPQKPQNWLIAIAHNVCRQRFRQATRRPAEVAFNENVAEAAPVESEGPSAADLTRALGHLAFSQRSALVLRELEGRSYGEIAEALHISVSAVETLLFRARRALREQLEGSLTCQEAELALSRRLDGRLARADRGPLRAHLRECKECAAFDRSQRGQRAAWKGLAAIPLPSSLASFFGGGGAGLGAGAAVGAGAATTGFGLSAKAVAVVTAVAVAGGVGYEGVKHPPWHSKKPGVARADTKPSLRPRVHFTRANQPAPAPSAASVLMQRAPSVARPVPTAPRTRPQVQGQKKQKQHKTKPRKDVALVAVQQQSSADERSNPNRNRAERGGDSSSESGLARSERTARGKTKPDRPAVGIARGEQGSKNKAKERGRSETAPPNEQGGGGNGRGSVGEREKNRDESPAQIPAAPPADQQGNGGGNGKDKHGE